VCFVLLRGCTLSSLWGDQGDFFVKSAHPKPFETMICPHVPVAPYAGPIRFSSFVSRFYLSLT
jgi:hypothetical protein